MKTKTLRLILQPVLGLMLTVWVMPAVQAARQAAAGVPATNGGPATVRRLNKDQYTRSIKQIFGDDVDIPGRFEPPFRDEGLLAIGQTKVSVTSSGLEQYELRSREIANAVLAEKRREKVLDCKLESPGAFDGACAESFLTHYGRLLYRRALTSAERQTVIELARAATEQSGDFYQGLSAGLARLIMSPNFIFRVERSEGNPDKPDGLRLDAYSIASRISFLLWDAPPDQQLLDAAEQGDLHHPAGLEQQVSRMMSSPKFAVGVRSFFADMLGFEQFEGLAKDQAIYPKYTSKLSEDAQEQLLLTIEDLLINNDGDYLELFTTRKTFLNRRLGSLYKVPVEYGAFDGWAPYTFEPQDKRAGLLSFAGILMLDPTHEGQSSPTIRGKMIREKVMCQTVPPPPPDVNFEIARDENNPLYKTARQRLTAHRENPVCAGCHGIMDPIGLGMENYDAIGNYRTHENGVLIDTTGKLDGFAFSNLLELGEVISKNPNVPACVVQRLYEYGVGRSASQDERDWLHHRQQWFAQQGYIFKELMRGVATSEAFQAVSADGQGIAKN